MSPTPPSLIYFLDQWQCVAVSPSPPPPTRTVDAGSADGFLLKVPLRSHTRITKIWCSRCVPPWPSVNLFSRLPPVCRGLFQPAMASPTRFRFIYSPRPNSFCRGFFFPLSVWCSGPFVTVLLHAERIYERNTAAEGAEPTKHGGATSLMFAAIEFCFITENSCHDGFPLASSPSVVCKMPNNCKHW